MYTTSSLTVVDRPDVAASAQRALLSPAVSLSDPAAAASGRPVS